MPTHCSQHLWHRWIGCCLQLCPKTCQICKEYNVTDLERPKKHKACTVSWFLWRKEWWQPSTAEGGFWTRLPFAHIWPLCCLNVSFSCVYVYIFIWSILLFFLGYYLHKWFVRCLKVCFQIPPGKMCRWCQIQFWMLGMMVVLSCHHLMYAVDTFISNHSSDHHIRCIRSTVLPWCSKVSLLWHCCLYGG